MDRRQFIKKSGIILAGTALTGIHPVRAMSALHLNNEVRIGVFGPSHCAAPVFFAQEKGFFAEVGVKVRVINYPSISSIAKDIAADNLDLGQLVMPLNFAINAGVTPINIDEPLYVAMVLGVQGSSLMTVKDAGIKTFADFRGKRIASTHKWSIHSLLTRYFLEQNGFDIQNDVAIQVAELDGFNKLVLENTIDAFMMPEPVIALAEETGKTSLFMLNKYIWQYHPCCCLNIKESVFHRKRQKIASVLSAVAKASNHINFPGNREELVKVLRKGNNVYRSIPHSVLSRAFSAERSGWVPFPYESSAFFIMKMMQDFGILSQFDIKSYVQKIVQADHMRICMQNAGIRAPKSNSRPETILGKALFF